MIFVNFGVDAKKNEDHYGVDLGIILGLGIISGTIQCSPSRVWNASTAALLVVFQNLNMKCLHTKKKKNIYQRKEISLFANTCIDDMMARENAL